MPPLLLPPHCADAAQDRADFAAFLLDFDLSAEWVAQVSANESDQIPMPAGWSIKIAGSLIHGQGMFAIHDLDAGDIIAPARMGGKRTPAGRYTNHAASPNACVFRHGDDPEGDIGLVALRDIAAGEEITIDYREACRLNGIGDEAKVAAYRAMPQREQMTSLIADMMAHENPAPPLMKHTFCNGMYMRELFIPAGTLLAGVIHKAPCLNICSSGDIDVLTERGMVRAGAGFTVASGAGAQKIGYAYTDTVWINVFRTDCLDVASAERELFMGTREMIAHLDPQGRHFTEFLKLQEAK